MVDDDNSFDLTFSDIATIEELEAAMDMPGRVSCANDVISGRRELRAH